MNRTLGIGRPLGIASTVGLLLALGVISPARTPAQGPAPSKARGDDLLKGEPFDRITLIDNTSYEVELLSPRPLPEPKKKTLVEIEESGRKAEERRGRRNDPFSKRDNADDEPPVIIHLLEGEPRDFKVKRQAIKSVEYFEDMLLAEAERMAKAGDYARAFERYLLVKARDPNWRGLEERVQRLLFDEGSAALAGDNARGLRLLSDLQGRKPDYPGLADRLAASFSKRIERAIAVGDFLAGRRLLRDQEAITPGHPATLSAKGRFVALAKAEFDAGMKAAPPQRVDRLAEAARIWPALEGLESAYRDAFRAEPTLVVGVVDLPNPAGPFPRSPAAERVAPLLYLPALASDDDAAMRGEVAGQLLAGVEVAELGRSLRLRVRKGPTWSDGSRPASALDVGRSLADRALPESPGYVARWAELLERVDVGGDDLVEVRLARQSLKPEWWLLGPVGPAHAADDGWVSAAGRPRMLAVDGPYRWEPDGAGAYLRASGEAGSPGVPKIRRIREVRFADPKVAVEAFIRGEVSLLEHVPPDRRAELAKDSAYKLGNYATPSVHFLAMDGRTAALRNRKLRRALSLAIDRKGLLEDTLLRRPPDDVNRVADGPFAKGSFVDAPDVSPLDYNPILAKGLVAAARKELGGDPIRLTLEYPSIAEARLACPKIAEAFALIGVEVQLLERPESELESGLRSGRRFDLAYRASKPASPLRDVGPMLIPGYDAPPSADALASAASPRILQLLVQLDRAPETTSAKGLALQVDREARDELPVLPLWQLEDSYAWRANLRGPRESSDRLYRGIVDWEVDPWFANDPK